VLACEALSRPSREEGDGIAGLSPTRTAALERLSALRARLPELPAEVRPTVEQRLDAATRAAARVAADRADGAEPVRPAES
jgi:hypothetical protein